MSKPLIIGFFAYGNTSSLLTKMFSEAGFDTIYLGRNIKTIKSKLEKINFDKYNSIILLGEKTKNMKSLSIEKIALNYFKNSRIDDIGLTAYESDYDIDSLVKRAKLNQVSIRVSYHAGVFLCNYAYYNLLKLMTNKNVVLIHVPRYSKNLNITKLYKDISSII